MHTRPSAHDPSISVSPDPPYSMLTTTKSSHRTAPPVAEVSSPPRAALGGAISNEAAMFSGQHSRTTTSSPAKTKPAWRLPLTVARGGEGLGGVALNVAAKGHADQPPTQATYEIRAPSPPLQTP